MGLFWEFLCRLEICGLGVRLGACLVILKPRQVDDWIVLNIGIFCEKRLILSMILMI